MRHEVAVTITAEGCIFKVYLFHTINQRSVVAGNMVLTVTVGPNLAATEIMEKWLCFEKELHQSFRHPLHVFLDSSSSIKVPQHSSHRPDKPFFHTICLALDDGDEVLCESHANVSANACKDVPPTVQLEDETPRKSDVMFDFRDIAAEVKVDAPEEVAEKEVC
jgi:uncharacterized protein YdeI (BOF family)